jgi:hypothetical protein
VASNGDASIPKAKALEGERISIFCLQAGESQLRAGSDDPGDRHRQMVSPNDIQIVIGLIIK